MNNKKLIKILVAQDDATSYKLLSLQTTHKKLPFDFDWVKNGEIAVERIKAGEDYDVILMNIEMPVMDGIEATVEIRKLGYTKPIIAWTAHFREYMWERCKKAGMNEFISFWDGQTIDEIQKVFRNMSLME